MGFLFLKEILCIQSTANSWQRQLTNHALARAPCLGLALLWSFPDLPATVPKTSVVGYRSKIYK